MFIISIVPFAVSSYIIKSYELTSSYQKSKVAFEAKQNLVIHKIENSIQQIAHINGFRMYIQSSVISRQRDRYKLLNKIELSLLHSPLIEGIELFAPDQTVILETGSKTTTSVVYNLKYTNDFIDEYGSTIGTIKAYLNKDALAEEFSSSYYSIHFTNANRTSFPIISSNTNSLFLEIATNENIQIQPKVEHSNYWIIYILIILVLLIMYFIIIRKILSKISEPIKDIESTAFSECPSINPLNLKIKELVWIKKVVDNVKIAKNNTTKNTYSQAEHRIRSFIHTLHSLKSNISSIKMIADAEVSNPMLNERIISTINNTVEAINEYKELSNNNYNQTGLRFSGVYQFSRFIRDYNNCLLSLRIDNSVSELYNKYLVPISIEAIGSMISNIATNAIESGAANFMIESSCQDNSLIIDMSNDGEELNLMHSQEYISGKSTKVLGTGTGISSINKILKSVDSSINFINPKAPYKTTVRIKLKLLENNIDLLIDTLKSSTTLSEIIIVNNVIHKDHFDETSVTHIQSCESYNYMELSRKSGILENQLYIHDIDIFINDIPYNAMFIENGKIVNIKSFIF